MNTNWQRSLGGLALFATVAGCGIPETEYSSKVAEADSLRAQLSSVLAELDEIKHGAARLLSIAQTDLEEQDYARAVENSQLLLDRHPDSQEAQSAASILRRAQDFESRRETAERARVEAERRAEEQRLSRALGQMRTRHDEIRDITWYFARSTPQYRNSRSDVHLYIGKEPNSAPLLRFVMQYVADDWLFIERFTVKADDATLTLTPGTFNVERDNGAGNIWEWHDTSAGPSELQIARAIADSERSVIRYEGQQYYRDRTVTASEKQAIKDVLAAYEVLQRKRY